MGVEGTLHVVALLAATPMRDHLRTQGNKVENYTRRERQERLAIIAEIQIWIHWSVWIRFGSVSREGDRLSTKCVTVGVEEYSVG